jgi:hypothetical protein
MSLEQALADNTAALNANTEVMKQLLAGREEALEKLTAAADKPASTRKPRAPKADAAAAPATATAPETTAKPEISDDDLRAAASAYVAAAGEDKAARQARGANLAAITQHFGTKTLVGPEGIQEQSDKAQTLFYIKRFTEGLPVDFSAEYDFDGDPCQGGDPVAETADEDEFAIG